MEEIFKQLAESVALGVEAAATLIIAAGAIEAMIGSGPLSILRLSTRRWPQSGVVALRHMADARSRV